MRYILALSVWLVTGLSTVQAFQQSPQGGTEQPPAVLNQVVQTGKGDQEKQDKNKEPTKLVNSGDLEDEDPNAVTVIHETVKVSDSPKTKDALSKLSDEKSYDKGVDSLIKGIGNAAVTAAYNESSSGNSGPHMILHILNIDDKTPNVRTTSAWYIWRKGIGFQEYSGTRLFGVSRIHVLTVIGPFKAAHVLEKFQGIEYRALVKKKLPANVQNLLGLLKITGFSAQSDAEAYLYGFGTLSRVAVVSDITISAYFRDEKDSTKLRRVGSKFTIDNEGYHWWDVSVGFPVKRVEELEYSQAGNTIQSKQIDKSTIFAFGDLYLRKVDIKNPGTRFAPAIVVGTGLKGKLRENLFVGLSTNFGPIPHLGWTKSGWWQLFRPYAGIQFMNVSRPVDNPAPGAPTQMERTIRKLSVGLNIPVLSTIERLVAKAPATPSTETATKKAAPPSDGEPGKQPTTPKPSPNK